MLKTVGLPSTRSGDQTIVDGNLVIGTAGKGVDFSADPSTPGMTSELLDDYEEGTWTPAQGSGVTVVGTFSSSGTYTKIGRLVYVTGFMEASTSIEVAGGSILTSNLPFQSSATGPIGRTLTANIYLASDNIPSGNDLYNGEPLTPTAYLRFCITLVV